MPAAILPDMHMILPDIVRTTLFIIFRIYGE